VEGPGVLSLHDLLESKAKTEGKPSLFGGIVWGRSAAMQTLRQRVASIASTDIPVFIMGESGTGKRMLALEIHHLSDRRDEPFITVNCRSITEGHLPEHFLTATNGNASAISCCRTILLDNICELEPLGQRRLLEVLPDETAEAGENLVRARLISTTHRKLEKDLRTGKFIEELYFRLNGVYLRVPSLRQRKQDLPELTDFFLNKYSDLFGRQAPKLSDEMLAQLAEYSWPGNIRQLENTMKGIVATGNPNAALGDLLETAHERPRMNATATLSLKAATREASRRVERELLTRALTRTRWNRKRAAQELQISYKSLLCKLKQLELKDRQAN
jgi:two-component system, NtrC family, response regulator AtoC